MSPLLTEACEWAASLTFEAIPADVRELAVAMSMSAAGARLATRRHPVHSRLGRAIPGTGWADLAAGDALLTMALDFDETVFAGHIGHAVAAVAFRAAVEAGRDGERAIVAMVAASEVAARLTASVTLGRTRGQTAAHTHAVAAVVAAGVVFDLGAAQMAKALGRVLSTHREVVTADFMSTDAKFWVAATPIRDAALALESDAEPSPSTFDDFLARMADVPLPQFFSGYGERWHLRTLSIKTVPGCAYIGAAVDAAASLGPLDLSTVENVMVGASIFTVGMERESAPYIDGPNTPLPALAFTTGYNVASALAAGGLGVEDLHGSRLADDQRWRVAGLTRVQHDPALTLAALAGTAPVGAAIAAAGAACAPYLAAQGASDDRMREVIARAVLENDPDMLRNSKRIGAWVRVNLLGGSVLEAERDAAPGSCQVSVGERLELAENKLKHELEAVQYPGAEAILAGYRGLGHCSSDMLRALVEAG